MATATSPRCSVLLSGGIDSALVAALLHKEGWRTLAVWVDYGQPAAGAERVASKSLAEHYDLEWREAVVRGFVVPPEGEVHGRNDMLVATARTCTPGINVAIGIHAGTSYVDCSPQWVTAWNGLLDVQYAGTVTLLAPLANLNKAATLALARDCEIPLELTYSCEAGITPCGECLSCIDRQAGNVDA